MLEQVSSDDNNYVYLVVQNSLNLPVLGNMQHSGYIASMIAESELTYTESKLPLWLRRYT